MIKRCASRSQTPIIRVLTFAVLLLFLAGAQVSGQQAPAIPDDIQAMLDRGRERLQAFRLDEASAEFGKALDAARQRMLPAPESDALRGLALVFASGGRHRNALELNREALAVAEKLGDKSRIGTALNNMGINYLDIKDPIRAIEIGRRALAIRTEIADRGGMAATMTNIAIALHSLGRNDEALELLARAAPMHREAGNRRFEANALSVMASIYRSQGDADRALASLLQVLDLRREIKDRPGEANQLFVIGALHQSRGALERARESFEASLALSRELRDVLGEAKTLGTLGAVYDELGLAIRALESIQQGVTAAKRTGNRRAIVQALISLGDHRRNEGEFRSAMETYQEALPVARTEGDAGLIGAVLENMCAIYVDMGQPETGLPFAQEAIELAKRAGDRHLEGAALNAAGIALTRLRQFAKAIDLFARVRVLSRETGDPSLEAGAITNGGNAHLQLGNSREALALLMEALPLHRAHGFRVYEANTLLSLGSLHRTMNHRTESLESYRSALALFRDLGYRDRLPTALVALARVLIDEKRYDEAEPLLTEAASLLERVRSGLGDLSGAKSAYLGSHDGAYTEHARLALIKGRNWQAFEFAQKTKARALVDLMAAGRVDLSKSLTPDERAREKALRDRVDRINADMIREGVRNAVGSKARYAALNESLAAAEIELQTFTDSLYLRYPELANRRAARTATLPEVARSLPPGTALIEYAYISLDHLVIYVVRGGAAESKALRTVSLKTPHNDLVQPILDFRARCGDPRKSVDGRAVELYKLLIKPLEPHLTGVRRLIICPFGVMWEAPFQVMLSPKGRLGERFEIAYAHSATTALMARRAASTARPKGDVLVVANPHFGSASRFGDLHELPGQRPIDRPSRPLDSPSRPLTSPSRPLVAPSRAIQSLSRNGKIISLPGTKREAEAIRRAYPRATVLVGTRAQETVARASMGQYRYVHFATHGFFNDASPMVSSIILAEPEKGSKDDGFLSVREIFETKLNTEMIVLSACNTARGTQGSGDGLIGLTWALSVAGCPTQVVSQWSVDDASTALLMSRFYENLAKRKMTKSAALKEASRWLRGRGSKYGHPYYWAPFVLMGDGR